MSAPRPQKHEREALTLARNLLGPSVTFERMSKCGALVYGSARLKVAMNSGCENVGQQVRAWARRIKGDVK